MTIPGDDLYHNCRCHHSSLTDVQTAATAVTDHHTDDELVHNVNRVKWHNNCNGDEVDTIVLMKTIKTIYSAANVRIKSPNVASNLITLSRKKTNIINLFIIFTKYLQLMINEDF